MQLRNRFYPYPVIIKGAKYYKDSSFSSLVNQEIDGYNIKLLLEVKLNDSKLLEMVDNGDVIYAHHIECPQTCYRTIVKTKEPVCPYLLRNSDVNGKVQVCSFLIANRDIKQYSNDSFSDDYRGWYFDIEEGGILAVGEQFDLFIDKQRDELKNTSSIFSIIKSNDLLENYISYDLNSQKIIITLPEVTYKQYVSIHTSSSILPLMHSMLIVPALLFAFSELKRAGKDLYEFEDYRWFRALKKACAAININLDEEGIQKLDIVKVPQQLMDSPVTKAIALCAEGGDEY